LAVRQRDWRDYEVSEPPTLPRINPRFSRILEQIPNTELNENERRVATLIARIPYGQVASFKTIADWAEQKYEYTGGNARIVANIRAKLYELLGHHTGLPLWRVTTETDDHAFKDSIRTRALGMQERIEEDSWDSPVWFETLKYDDPL
jgi:alkylated DNA nucleotide flippase Atl1